MNQEIIRIFTGIAVDNLGKIVELGEGGVKALKVLLDTNGIKAKNDKIEKMIGNYYAEIGRTIYEKKLVVNNSSIKEKIEEINNCKKEIERNVVKINEMRQKAKEEGVRERDFEVVKNIYEKLSEEKDIFKTPKKKKVKSKK